MKKAVLALVSVAFLFSASATLGADPATTCLSGKLRAAGKYASCVLSVEARAAKTSDPADYTKCNDKLGSAFSKAEVKGGGECPNGTGDQGDIQAFLDGCRASVADALASSATLPVPGGVGRSFTDNGDGTITDNVTGLMWEKLSDDGSIHDQDNEYTWADAGTVKVGALNSANFAGHNDWRVPDVNELQTLVDYAAYNPATYAAFSTGCTAGCAVTTCSCTVSSYCCDTSSFYWSATSFADDPDQAWGVYFFAGGPGILSKSFNLGVRAVRSGF